MQCTRCWKTKRDKTLMKYSKSKNGKDVFICPVCGYILMEVDHEIVR